MLLMAMLFASRMICAPSTADHHRHRRRAHDAGTRDR